MAILFYIFAAVAVIAGLNVVLQRRPVYSALWLIVVLCALAVEYLLLGAVFMAFIQIIVYAGAIMVLFVLVIMLLNAHHEEPTHGSQFAQWLGAPLVVALLVEIGVAVWSWPGAAHVNPPPLRAGPKSVGDLLFHQYVLPFEVTSALILVAILGAVVLARKES